MTPAAAFQERDTASEGSAWLDGVAYDPATRHHLIDGRPVPSVTQVLAQLAPQRFARVRSESLARACAIGQAVHTAAQYLAEDDLDETTVAPEAASRVDAWKWFTETRNVQPLLTEAVVCSRDRGLPLGRRFPYIGRLDLVAVVDRRFLVLLDIKTGRADRARLQTMAYFDALCQQFPSLLALDVQRWAVVLPKAGGYQVHRFRNDADDARDFRTALAAAYRADDAPWRR
jgi:hypothetical protein